MQGFKEAGINFVVFMPESTMLPAARMIEKDKDFTFIQVSNEGTGAAICAGAWLGGKKPVMLMESPGLLLSSYALARFLLTFGTPVLLIVSHRGDIGDPVWWSSFSGPALKPALEALQIKYVEVSSVDDLKRIIIATQASLGVEESPRAIVLGSGCFA